MTENPTLYFWNPKTKNHHRMYTNTHTPMDHPKHSSLGLHLTFLSLLLACIVYLCIWLSSSSLINPLFPFQKHDVDCTAQTPDTDVLWLRDPFTKLSKNETEDLQISTDMFFGDPWNVSQLINTGFYYIRSNNKTIALFDRWYTSKDNATGLKEQDVLLNLIRGGIVDELGLRVRFLDTLYFSGFCQDSKDFGQVSTVHANCCRSIVAKVKDLKAVLGDWKRFKKFMSHKRSSGTSTRSFQWTGHFGCLNSWAVPNNSGSNS
ncbi:unnamed protein product [Malus baccata var. baccata]